MHVIELSSRIYDARGFPERLIDVLPTLSLSFVHEIVINLHINVIIQNITSGRARMHS